jgi:hypothetical protein
MPKLPPLDGWAPRYNIVSRADLPPFPIGQGCQYPECNYKANTRIRGPHGAFRYACPAHAEEVAEAWRIELGLEGWSEAEKREAFGR